uniref:PHD-type domain-containing protein n=1 Tax=Attheya septentrionalis TaxID=420275 RepID=A0A7S2UGX8_9STRA
MSVPERGSVESIASEKENSSKTRIKLRLVAPENPESPSSRPTPIYGVPPRSHRGVCATCFGERNEKAQNEPVLLCDGQGCSREYHLNCTTPLLTEVPSGKFYCPECENLGTTRELEKYFKFCEEARCNFSSSRMYVEHVLQKQLSGSGDTAESFESENSKTEQPEPTKGNKRGSTSDGKSSVKKKKRRKSGESNLDKVVSGTTGKSASEKKSSPDKQTKHPFPRSEVCDLARFHSNAMSDIESPFSHKKSKMKFEEDIVPSEELRPSFLVGRQVRLYCSFGNTYHVGRIVDWRKGSHTLRSSSDDEISDSDYFFGASTIAACEFLVRFQAGTDGRKRTVHHWIILEEHSIGITAGIIWGQRQKGRGMKGWKPAQILVRTSLELIPVRHLLEQKEGIWRTWALSLFFGESVHALLRLRDESVDFFSQSFCADRELKIASYTSSQQGSSSGRSNNRNEADDLAINLARVEHWEQQRIFKWHKMILQNPAHIRALTIVDESTLIPIGVSSLVRHSTHYDSVETEDDTVNSNVDTAHEPKLCMSIEQGIDRQWLAQKLGAVGDIEVSMDTLASFSCKPVSCLSSAISQLNK